MITTFYSYKGGVGRTQLVANLAAYLCFYHDRKVLLIDWDLEAPGLHYFFKIKEDDIEKGLIDYFSDYYNLIKNNNEPNIEDLSPIENFLIDIKHTSKGGKISLIPAGGLKNKEHYVSLAGNFNWYDFYEKYEGKLFVEYFKTALNDLGFDYIFIDSRTGISDYSGICTVQMPDFNVIVTAPSQQNLEGSLSISKGIMDTPYFKKAKAPRFILPVLSRLEVFENERPTQWIIQFRETFLEILRPFLLHLSSDYLLSDEEIKDLVKTFVDSTLLEYKTDLSYGEIVLFNENKKEIESTTIEKKYWEIATIIESLNPNFNLPLNLITHSLKAKIPHFLTPIPLLEPVKDIVGRKEDIDKLERLLNTSTSRVLINGLGGIGKTTLAQAYISLNHIKYQHLIWINQGEDLISTIALDQHLAKCFDLPIQNGEDINSRFIQIMQAIGSMPGPNLLVIDNVTEQISTPKIFSQLPQLPNWKILITSRYEIMDFMAMEIQVLQPKAALDLFRFYYSEGDDEEVKELLEEIGYHTLTIELLAKTLQRKNGLITVSELLESIRTGGLDDPKLIEKLSARHSGKEEQGVFNYLMRLYDFAELTDKEVWVLQQLAVLPALPLDTTILAGWLKEDVHELNLNLNELKDKGWLSRQGNEIIVNRLIQELIKYKNPPGEKELETLLLTMTEKMFTNTSSNSVKDNFPWLPYAEKVAEYFANVEILPDIVSALWNNLANVLRDLGDYTRAAQLLEGALASDLYNFGPEHPSVAVRQSNLASVYRDLGNYDRAAQLLELALDSDLRNFGPEHPNVAVRQSNLAAVYRDLGNYDRAAQLLQSALDSDLQNFGPEHPNVAVRQSNLALIFINLGHYARAAQLLQSALDSDLQNFGPDHPNVARNQSNLANVLSDLGDYERAAQLLESALDSDLRNFGERHPNVARSQSNLANVLSDLGDYERAAQLLERALESDLRNFGERHPNVARSQSNLANVLSDLGDYERAAQLLQNALDSDLQNFGPDHPNVAVSQHNLATVYYQVGLMYEAKELLERALQVVKKSLGENHPQYKGILSWLEAVDKKL